MSVAGPDRLEMKFVHYAQAATDIQVKVEDGWVTLTGTTDLYYQRSTAETDARRVVGVKGIMDAAAINFSYTMVA